MVQRQTAPSQVVCYILLARLVTCVDIVSGTKAKSSLSLQCSPLSRSIIDKAYYINVSGDVCGADCQHAQLSPNASCHPYEDTDVCALVLPASDVSLLYSSCYADNASCGSQTFSHTSRRENISLFFICSDGDAVDPCGSGIGESSTLFHHFAAPAPQTNVTCTCEVEVPHLVEGSSLRFTYLVFHGLANTESQVSPSAALTLPGSREVFLNTSTYPLSGELPVLAKTLRVVVSLRVTGLEHTSARFWLRFEKRAKTECQNGRLSSQVDPDADHDPTVPQDTSDEEYHWTPAGIIAIVSGLSAVAATIVLVICATKQCVLFRPRKRRPICLEPLASVTTYSTDPVSQTEVSVEYYVDQSTTGANPHDLS